MTSYAIPVTTTRLAECPLCFEPLANEPILILRQKDGRSCGHYIHERCAHKTPPQHSCCPVCGVRYTGLVKFPDISDPQAWFQAVDTDFDGRLTKDEVVAALKATCRGLDVAAFDRDIDSLWVNWDANRDGYVTIDEIFRENIGLLAYARQAYAQTRSPVDPPPLSDQHAWFTFWDGDRSNTLDKAEVHRALVKTFDLEADPSAIAAMGSTLDAVWGIFDMDNNGTIDRGEFVAPDGLGATLAANLAHMKRRVYPAFVAPDQHAGPYAAQPGVPHATPVEAVAAPSQHPNSYAPYGANAQPATFYAGQPTSYQQQPTANAYGGSQQPAQFRPQPTTMASPGSARPAAQPAVVSAPRPTEAPPYLPPYWEERLAPGGRIYYANNQTRQTQWERPVA